MRSCHFNIALALVSLAVAPLVCGSDTAHLVPVEPDFGVSQPLGKLFTETYQKSLFTKRDWLIRYYRADTPVNVTIAFSIYLKDQTFWVNVSHATPEMDPLIREAAEKDRFDVSSVLGQIDLKSFNFPISRSTGTTLSKVWRNLLSEVRPDPSLRDRVFTDGPMVILFAKDESNQLLSGRVPPSAEQNAKFRQIEEMFTDLMKACTASKKQRARIYRDMEARSQQIFNVLREEQQVQNRSLSTETAGAQLEHIHGLLGAQFLKEKPQPKPEDEALVQQINTRAGLESVAISSPQIAEKQTASSKGSGGSFVLLSWKNTKSDYQFALIPLEKEEGFLRAFQPGRRGLRGLGQLKTALDQLPAGTPIVWEDDQIKGLTYPPISYIDQITTFGRSKGLQIELNPVVVE